MMPSKTDTTDDEIAIAGRVGHLDPSPAASTQTQRTTTTTADELDPAVRLEAHLEKTAANVGRIQHYFNQRRTWRIDDPELGVLAAFHDSLVNVAEHGIEPVLLYNRISLPAHDTRESVEQLPSSQFDGGRLRKFTEFLDQLRRWFGAHSDVELSPRGRALIARSYLALVVATSAVEAIAASSRQERATQDTSAQEITEAGAPDADQGPVPDPIQEIEQCDAVLVLEDTEQTPMLQEFRNKTELTFEAKQEIQGFIEEAMLELDRAELARFEYRVMRWIEATPPGHVLRIKVSVATGRPEPYANYVRKAK